MSKANSLSEGDMKSQNKREIISAVLSGFAHAKCSELMLCASFESRYVKTLESYLNQIFKHAAFVLLYQDTICFKMVFMHILGVLCEDVPVYASSIPLTACIWLQVLIYISVS